MPEVMFALGSSSVRGTAETRLVSSVTSFRGAVMIPDIEARLKV